MAETMEQWAKNRISEQPAFNTEEEARKRALEELRKEETTEVWKTPDGKYIACNWRAFEAAVRLGCERIVDSGHLADDLQIDEIDEV